MARPAFRLLAAFAAAVISGAALGSVIQTQFNLAFIARLGVEVPLATRLQTTLADVAGFGPLLAALVAAAYAIGFVVAEPLATRFPHLRRALYPLAGAGAVAAAILLLNAALPMTPIAATRSAAGTIALAAAGAVGGAVYHAVRGS